MNNNNKSRALIKATFVSLGIAITVLLLFILPAEYNIDPTGIGQKMGLTALNDTKSVTTNSEKILDNNHEISLMVPAGRGIEYKLAMNQFGKVTYEWKSNGSSLYVDLHGEPKGDTTGYFESYTIATVDEMKGSFTAPFKGSHGWYWKNKTEKNIQVELIFSGDYVIEGLKP